MPCPDEDTIQQIFDALTYSKGASCLKMVMNYGASLTSFSNPCCPLTRFSLLAVGEEGFLKGVSNYLKNHLYGNATTSDLLSAISSTTGKDVSTLLKNWLGKTGFPLLEVEETATGIKVSQRRFLSTGDATPEEDQTIWHVPLQLLVVEKDGKKEIKSDIVLTERSTEIEITDVKNTTYKLNANTCGVYRTRYSVDRLAKLGDEAGKTASAFSLEDRIGLVADASALASSGYAKTSGAFTLVSKLKGETENLGAFFAPFLLPRRMLPVLTSFPFSVWQEIANTVASVSAAWWDQPAPVREALAKFRRELVTPLVEKLGYEYPEGEDSDTVELRTVAVSTAAVTGDAKCVFFPFPSRHARFPTWNEVEIDQNPPLESQDPRRVQASLRSLPREERRLAHPRRSSLLDLRPVSPFRRRPGV